MNKITEVAIKVLALLIFGPLVLAVIIGVIGVIALSSLVYSVVIDWKKCFIAHTKLVFNNIDKAFSKVEANVEHPELSSTALNISAGGN